ncbi:MAG: glycosyltransferase [Campylobacterota bacterium]|nr:glycosyltransferase [Campylobacterota bacterium]
MSLIKEAARLFKEKKYKEAHQLYIQAGKKYGKSIFQYQISKCERLTKQNNDNINIETNLSIRDNSSIINSSNVLDEYFDNIYVVNLKHKVSDRLKVSQHLKEHNINFEIFEATNGYVGEPLTKWNEYKKRPLGTFKRNTHYKDKEIKFNKSYIESPGAIGYIYTYIRILEDAKLQGYNRFLILEDDILLCNNFEIKFKVFIEGIDKNWKILQLGASQYGWSSVDTQTAISDGYYLPRTMDTKGSYAIAFDLSIVDEVLEEQKAFEAPFDHIPMGELYERHLNKCFVAFPHIILPDVSESSIRGGRCQYTHSKRMKWPLENYDYPLYKPSIAVILTSKNNLKYYSEFSNIKDLPFNLRLYFNSSDGIRVLHNKELLDLDINLIKTIDYSIINKESDYVVTLSESSILTEEAIVEFIEFKTNIREANTTLLTEISINKKEIIADRASVIIPTYKRPTNLRIALESVVKQDYKDIEVIIVSDNGDSSRYNKETREIVNSLKNINPNCKVVLIEHYTNRNGSAARNTGILHSSGEFISFLDDDDAYLPGRLSKSIENLKKQKKIVGAVYCGFLGWNSPKNDLNRYKIGDLTREILLLEYKKHYIHTNTATYRREAILNINGFDESYRRHQDLEFNLRFFEQYEIEAVKEALVRLNPEPSDVSNKAFNTVMLDLKFKFLTQFKYLIEKYSIEVQYEIYSLHQNEALKYIKEKSKALELYKNKFEDYNIQMLLKLAYSSNPKAMKILDTTNNVPSNRKEVVYYKIIGNNMPGLQSDEQSFSNIVHIVANESNFESVDKYFILNRIIDKEYREKIVNYLESKKINYLEITFNHNDYKEIGYDFKNLKSSDLWFSELSNWDRLVLNAELRESKNRYLMNNNGARNFAIKHGKKSYKWIMPWDGNCFISESDYITLEDRFKESGNHKYVCTPMERTIDINNTHLKAKNPNEEPQISFRYDSTELFTEERVYGNQPKVELFKKLGYAGKWDEWKMLTPWRELKYTKSIEAGLVSSASAVFRLPSGNKKATLKACDRNIYRKKGISDFIDYVDSIYILKNLKAIDFKIVFPSLFKHLISNPEIRKGLSKLLFVNKSTKVSEATIIEYEKIVESLILNFNSTPDANIKLNIMVVLFSNMKINKKMIFTNDTQSFMQLEYLTIYKNKNLNDFNTLQTLISDVFIAMLMKLYEHSVIDSVKLKFELIMLLNFYYSNKSMFKSNKDLESSIKIINVVFKEVFEYDFFEDAI